MLTAHSCDVVLLQVKDDCIYAHHDDITQEVITGGLHMELTTITHASCTALLADNVIAADHGCPYASPRFPLCCELQHSSTHCSKLLSQRRLSPGGRWTVSGTRRVLAHVTAGQQASHALLTTRFCLIIALPSSCKVLPSLQCMCSFTAQPWIP